jgi:hypothetical protein
MGKSRSQMYDKSSNYNNVKNMMSSTKQEEFDFKDDDGDDDD